MSWTSDVKAHIGKQIGVSDWKTVSQSRIDLFAQATDDFQFVHVDPHRAARDTPFGGTIAHGFLTLSLISSLASEIIPASSDLGAIVLVAIDRVKFMEPMRSGSAARGVFKLERAHWLSHQKLLLKMGCLVEIRGEKKPALTCEVSWIAMFNEATTGQQIPAPELNRVV